VTTYGVLGVGSIATAIVNGLCDGVVEPPKIVLSPRNAERAAELVGRLPSVRLATDNQQVVDDSDVVRDALDQLLTSCGYFTELYASAEEFLRSATVTPATCLVVDVNLGDISGPELLRALAARGLHFPVILMSGSCDAILDLHARIAILIARDVPFETETNQRGRLDHELAGRHAVGDARGRHDDYQREHAEDGFHRGNDGIHA